MKKPSKENLVNDIENRLDDFFNENEEENLSESKAISIEKLKSVVLSIDWEITEECLNDLIDETDLLLPKFEKDRYCHTLLRMLKSVGAYIRKRKARAHPDAMKRIMSVFSSIEKLTEDNSHMEETLKKQIVAKEINEFKKLKKQVEIQSSSLKNHSEPISSDSKDYGESNKFEQTINSIEQRFSAQVEDLKSQIETLQNKINHIKGS